MTVDDNDIAVRLLDALQRAGCWTFIDDGEFMCSPPLPPQRIEWHTDIEAALDEHAGELRDLLLATGTTVH
jgi:hypothetical protein